MTNLEATETAELADMHYLLGSMLFRINNLAVQWSYVPPVPEQQEQLYYIPEVQAPTDPQPDMVAAQEPDVQQYEAYEAVEPQPETFVPAVEETAVPEADVFQPVVEEAVVPQAETIQSVNVEAAIPDAVYEPVPAPAVQPEVMPAAPIEVTPPPVVALAPPAVPAAPTGPIVPVVPVRPMRPAVSAPVRPPMPRQIPKPGNDFNSRLNKILNS